MKIRFKIKRSELMELSRGRKEWCENSIRVKRFNLGKFHQWKSPLSGLCGLAHATPNPIFIFFQRLLVVGKCLQKYWVSFGREPMLNQGCVVDSYTSSLVDQLPSLFVVVVWCFNSLPGLMGNDNSTVTHPPITTYLSLSYYNPNMLLGNEFALPLLSPSFLLWLEKDILLWNLMIQL